MLGFGLEYPVVFSWKLLFNFKSTKQSFESKVENNSKYSKTFEPEAEPDLKC